MAFSDVVGLCFSVFCEIEEKEKPNTHEQQIWVVTLWMTPNSYMCTSSCPKTDVDSK